MAELIKVQMPFRVVNSRIVWPCAEDVSFRFLPCQLSMAGYRPAIVVAGDRRLAFDFKTMFTHRIHDLRFMSKGVSHHARQIAVSCNPGMEPPEGHKFFTSLSGDQRQSGQRPCG